MTTTLPTWTTLRVVGLRGGAGGSVGGVEEPADGASETAAASAPGAGVVEVQLCSNAQNTMTRVFWREMVDVFTWLGAQTDHVRVILLTAQPGRIFSAGLDLADHASLFSPDAASPAAPAAASPDAPPHQQRQRVPQDPARRAHALLHMIRSYQDAFNVLERIPQPVIAVVHGAAIGGAVDLLCACDIRIATHDATLSIKEVDVGMAADVGTLQRLERLVGSVSTVREWAYTARTVTAAEAARVGFFSSPVHATRDAALAHARALCATIASKSPVAITGTKHMLNHARDHALHDSLEFAALWNMSMLQTHDMRIAVSAQAAHAAAHRRARSRQQAGGGASAAESGEEGADASVKPPVFAKL